MNAQITVQIDPDTGNALVTIPAELVQHLGWSTDSMIRWVLDQDRKTLTAKLVK